MTERGGAPIGNQNARKHGIYSKVLDEAEKQDFENAARADGLDEEIALLRVKIASLLRRDPDNVLALGRAVESLGRLVVAKSRMPRDDADLLESTVREIFKDTPWMVGLTDPSVPGSFVSPRRDAKDSGETV